MTGTSLLLVSVTRLLRNLPTSIIYKHKDVNNLLVVSDIYGSRVQFLWLVDKNYAMTNFNDRFQVRHTHTSEVEKYFLKLSREKKTTNASQQKSAFSSNARNYLTETNFFTPVTQVNCRIVLCILTHTDQNIKGKHRNY
jgi:hypothetical protein